MMLQSLQSKYSAHHLKKFEAVVRLSGEQYSIRYVGSMKFATPVSSIEEDQRPVIARECIAKVCEETLRQRETQKEKESRLRFSVSDVFDSFDEDMDLNIAIRAISVIQYTEENFRVIARFPMEDISLFAMGEDAYSSMFCFFAYYHHDDDEAGQKHRRCFVFDGKPSADMVFDSLNLAMELFCLEQERLAKGIEQTTYNQLPAVILDGADMSEIEKAKANLYITPTSPSTSSQSASQLSARGQTRDRQRSTSRRRSNMLNKLLNDERFANVWHQTWFHGILDRAAAEALIHREGQFLVRLSPNGENNFVLSGMSRGEHCHVSLTEDGGNMRLGTNFKTIVGFICYCRKNRDYLFDHKVHMLLTDSVNCKETFLFTEEE